MRKIIFPIIGLCFLLSCDNEVQLNAPFKDIPVVYGLLSASDTAHYIRIEKAFLVENENALELARDPNQLYYDHLEVSLTRQSTGETFSLKRISGADDGYPRKDGIFIEEPNYLYKVNQTEILLDEGDVIQIAINRGEGFDPVTASTPIIGSIKINQPNPDNTISFKENVKTRFRWTDKANASFYSVKLYLKYLEADANNGGDFEEKVLEWPVKEDIGTNKFDIDGHNFFVFLSNSLASGEQFRRIFSKVDVRVDAGGLELQKYIEQGLVNIGITGSQEVDAYSNLSEGVGVFSTRNSIITPNYNISQVTRDSLINGRFTKALNFE